MRPLDLLSALVLDRGALWGETATDLQRADAAALLDHRPEAARLHFLTRPRGGSKTTDLAAVALTALITQAPARCTSHAFARDRDQAALLLDALGGLVARTGLGGLVDVGSWTVTVRESGARLAVESADAASAYGHLPFLVIADELAQWPTTRGARALWEALVSGLPKTSRLPARGAHHGGRPRALVRQGARRRAHLGPLARLAGARTAAVGGPRRPGRASPLAARLCLRTAAPKRWTAAEDRLTSAEDLAACVTLDGPQPPDPRHRYVIGLDLGLKNDRTVLAVCHAEGTSGPPLVVLDRLHVLSGTRERPVSLADVEAVAYEAATAYGAPIRLDPWQAVGLAQRLRARGVTVTEWTFSPVSVGRLAMTLHLLLREHRLALPEDADLLDELATVRLRESRPGVYRLDHDAGQHDDRAVALGLAALALTERTEARGGIVSPTTLPRVVRTVHDARPSLPTRLALRKAAGRQTPGQRRAGLGLLVPGSANDPRPLNKHGRGFDRERRSNGTDT